MSYLLIGEGQEDREITKDEYTYLLEKLVEYRLNNYFKELIR
nr:MAG TPA: hypothetical protein [Caudoviricetes sp.]